MGYEPGLGCYSLHRGQYESNTCTREGAAVPDAGAHCAACCQSVQAEPRCLYSPRAHARLVTRSIRNSPCVERAGGFGESVGEASRCLAQSRFVQRNGSASRRGASGCYTLRCTAGGGMEVLLDGDGALRSTPSPTPSMCPFCGVLHARRPSLPFPRHPFVAGTSFRAMWPQGYGALAETQPVTCPSGETIALPSAAGFVSDDDYPSNITCPDAAELCGPSGHPRGALTCGANATCSQRGHCVDGICRCNLLHTGADCSESIFASEALPDTATPEDASPPAGSPRTPPPPPPPQPPLLPPPRSATPPFSPPQPRSTPPAPAAPAAPPSPQAATPELNNPPTPPPPPRPVPSLTPREERFELRTGPWSDCAASSGAHHPAPLCRARGVPTARTHA